MSKDMKIPPFLVTLFIPVYGEACDGRVLVINDALGLGDYWPLFSKQCAHVGD